MFEQFVASNDAFLGVLEPLDDAGWSTVAETPAGHVSIRLLAFHALWDGWIHERDIALPLGLAPAEEPDEIASCLRYAAAVGPALSISQEQAHRGTLTVLSHDPAVAFTVTVGDVVEVRDGIDASAPCLCGSSIDLVETLSVSRADARRCARGVAPARQGLGDRVRRAVAASKSRQSEPTIPSHPGGGVSRQYCSGAGDASFSRMFQSSSSAYSCDG